MNLFLKWAQAQRGSEFPAPRVVFSLVDESASVNKLAADFFLSGEMATAAAKTSLAREARDLYVRIHTEVAERLATYLVLAVGGELRHTHSDWLACGYEFQELQERFGLLTAEWTEYGQKALVGSYFEQREQAQVSALGSLKGSAATPARFMELAVAVFTKGLWSGSMGGSKWAHIAQTVLDFLSGACTHTVFADHAFDLEHNGGRMFDKHKMVRGNDSALKQQLEAKKHTTSVKAMAEKVCALTRLCSRVTSCCTRTWLSASTPRSKRFTSRGKERGYSWTRTPHLLLLRLRRSASGLNGAGRRRRTASTTRS